MGRNKKRITLTVSALEYKVLQAALTNYATSKISAPIPFGQHTAEILRRRYYILWNGVKE